MNILVAAYNLVIGTVGIVAYPLLMGFLGLIESLAQHGWLWREGAMRPEK